MTVSTSCNCHAWERIAQDHAPSCPAIQFDPSCDCALADHCTSCGCHEQGCAAADRENRTGEGNRDE